MQHETQPFEIPGIIELRCILKDRRLELELSQDDVSRCSDAGSSEFISMVERGVRSFRLDKVIDIADTLALDAGDLLKLQLFEQSPRSAVLLFGQKATTYQPRVTEPTDATTRGIDYAVLLACDRLCALSPSARNTVLQMIDELYELNNLQSPPVTTLS